MKIKQAEETTCYVLGQLGCHKSSRNLAMAFASLLKLLPVVDLSAEILPRKPDC